MARSELHDIRSAQRNESVPRGGTSVNVTAMLEDLERKRAYLAERLAKEPLPPHYAAAAAVKAEIGALGLAGHALELETDGYTILRPEEVDSGDLVERLVAAMDRVAETRHGVETQAIKDVLFHLVPEDPVFEEVLLSPKPLALLTYLLGYHAKLNQSSGLFKPKGGQAVPFHADTAGKFPMPWPETAQVANVTWLLSDYTREGGCLCVVPGSHRLGAPSAFLPLAYDHPSVVPIEAPVGSVVVWHGGLWHGSLPRTIDGLRRTLVLYFSRAHLEAQEPYKLTTTFEMLERNPARFGALMGLTDRIPWGLSGPSGNATEVTGIQRFE